ncbi:hypothetical protein [Phenylobacterium sp.]|uniref:hypothetical protein n=1 Tax=Phenylobacterium sp. TaxID=1871053 RepID=UPI0035B3F1B2
MIDHRAPATTGLVLFQTLPHRQRAARRRLVAIAGAILLAAGGWIVGAVTAAPAGPAALGPFSYFPF